MSNFHTPKTGQVLEDAYYEASPEHGEGWDAFARHIRREMEEWEILICEAREHIKTYDDGMAGWLDRTSDFSAQTPQ